MTTLPICGFFHVYVSGYETIISELLFLLALFTMSDKELVLNNK